MGDNPAGTIEQVLNNELTRIVEEVWARTIERFNSDKTTLAQPISTLVANLKTQVANWVAANGGDANL